MNAEKYARTTFVLDRETNARLNYVARRMGVSRSELVRDVLEEPVRIMEQWVRQTPANATPEQAAQSLETIQGDLVEFIEQMSSDAGMDLHVKRGEK